MKKKEESHYHPQFRNIIEGLAQFNWRRFSCRVSLFIFVSHHHKFVQSLPVIYPKKEKGRTFHYEMKIDLSTK